jgi:DNA-binding response OmpR family regulator
MARSEPIHILYVEDDPGLARLVQKKLQRAGYVVDIASDGEQGVAKFEADSYDLMFVDQNLPVYDGLEVIRILGSKGILPPTIMITGSGDEKVAVEAMKLGAGDYIVKDVAAGYIELLPSAIEKMLRQHRAIKEKQHADRHREMVRRQVLIDTPIQELVLKINYGIFIPNRRHYQPHGIYERSDCLCAESCRHRPLQVRQLG